MKGTLPTRIMAWGSIVFLAAVTGVAGDWPQWRGPNRDAKATGFDAPETWPAELSQAWQVTVGDGVATPALVGDKLYVFTRQGGNEVLRCLDAETGEEIWRDEYAAPFRGTGDSGYPGPRSSPTVADGKVLTLGVNGTLSCVDAASGDVLWRNTDYEGSTPMFHTSSSPIVVDGLCIAQLGGQRDGVILACDLATGEEKWKLEGESPAHGSPMLVRRDNTTAIVAPTARYIIALDAATGNVLLTRPMTQRYNAVTPIVEGQLLVHPGNQGLVAVKLTVQDGELKAEEVWSNPDNNLQFSTPLIKDGLLFGYSQLNSLFCVDVATGQTLWNAPFPTSAASGDDARPTGRAAQPAQERGGRQFGGRSGPGGRGGRRGGGGRDFGSLVDAGPVLFALTPAAQLVVMAPSAEGLRQLASYKVAQSETHAHPVPAGKAIYIKDQDSVIRWNLP